MHFTVIDAVAAAFRVDTVVHKSEHSDHSGSRGSDWASKYWEGSKPGLFGCQKELTTLLAAPKVALSRVCVKHPNGIVKNTREKLLRRLIFSRVCFMCSACIQKQKNEKKAKQSLSAH